MRARFLTLFAASLALVSAGAATAHDYWLELRPFRPTKGQTVVVSHRVGEALAGEAVPRSSQLLRRFELVSASGRIVSVPGQEGVDPAGLVKAEELGPSRIVYQGERSPVELDSAKFERYLIQEGLESALAERRRRGESGRVASEVFSRSAVGQLCVGNVPGGAPSAVGLEIEIVPKRDLCALAVGEEVEFVLLFRGRPIAGLLAMALAPGAAEEPLQVRTGSDGSFRLRFPRGGFWLVKAVHMDRSEGLPGVEWESFWASYTFEIR